MGMAFEKYQRCMAVPQTADFTLIRFCREATGESYEYRLSGFSEQMRANGLDGSILRATLFEGLNAQQIAAVLKRNGFMAEVIEQTSEYRAAWIDFQKESREIAARFCSDLYQELDLSAFPVRKGTEICKKAWRDNRGKGLKAVFEAAQQAKSEAIVTSPYYKTANNNRSVIEISQ